VGDEREGGGDIDALIAGLYRAAAGETTWSEALQAIVDRFACWGVQVLGIRRADGAMDFSHDAGFPAEGMLHYLRSYHRIDPRTPLLGPLAVGQWWHCHEHFDDAFIARHPLYQDVILPYGGRYSSGTKLCDDDELLVLMSVHRGPQGGPLTAPEQALVSRIGRHAQIAFALWRRQRRVLQQARAGEAIVSRLAQPVLLVDARLQVLHCNAAASALLARRGGTAERAGRLTCATAAAQNELVQALQRLGVDAAESGNGRAVVRDGNLLLVLSCLRPDETLSAFGTRDVALVLLHDLGERRLPDPLLVGAAFGLTPAEAQVACAVAGGASPQQIAARSGVSVNTVRTQLAMAFQKVGVGRQSELASALGGLASL